MRAGAVFICFLLLLAGTADAAVPPKLVFRVDRATATISHRHLVITAGGAVCSGGWGNPTLRVLAAAPEAKTIEVEFMARPPRHRAAVVQAILPVSAKLKTGLPRYGAVEVKIVSENNSVTVPITVQDNARTEVSRN